jgi:hypothetical protein
MPEYTQDDATELAARRAHDVAIAAKYTGVKPLVVWYGAWTALLALSVIMSPFDGRGLMVSFLSLVVATLGGLYTRYLYRGGRHRVWFVFF